MYSDANWYNQLNFVGGGDGIPGDVKVQWTGDIATVEQTGVDQNGASSLPEWNEGRFISIVCPVDGSILYQKDGTVQTTTAP